MPPEDLKQLSEIFFRAASRCVAYQGSNSYCDALRANQQALREIGQAFEDVANGMKEERPT